MRRLILLSYGSPESIDELGEYLSMVFYGDPVPERIYNENRKKYELYNGRSPSNDILKCIEEKLKKALREYDFDVTQAYKHWKPGIENIVEDSKDFDEIFAIPLFPFSTNNVKNSYEKPFNEALKKYNVTARVRFLNGLEDQELLYSAWIEKISGHMYNESPFLFAAHSLPLYSDESTYENLIINTARRLSNTFLKDDYFYGFYSQGEHGKWLYPSIYDYIDKLKEYNSVTVIPIGFIYEHLEILYDLDIEFKNKLKDYGISYDRVETPSCSDTLVMAIRNKIISNIK
ncbi:ferrochelatase [Picrophilus oshimae]|uniref:Ferrochelatase n=1 Tax=Picrophilus torridus (strain ATCC 700027 / DSM 9790 / JCM 10055 / NBRC 100828 / KAW 2/3) TaxID=1122961 RepID=A0A8G2FVB5_PICTO|nr:ferrochelatase [Picrophilus oshimae]SMD30155.1 ferrochelatase [Picrophilus oshimae DSM 9789]